MAATDSKSKYICKSFSALSEGMGDSSLPGANLLICKMKALD